MAMGVNFAITESDWMKTAAAFAPSFKYVYTVAQMVEMTVANSRSAVLKVCTHFKNVVNASLAKVINCVILLVCTSCFALDTRPGSMW